MFARAKMTRAFPRTYGIARYVFRDTDHLPVNMETPGRASNLSGIPNSDRHFAKASMWRGPTRANNHHPSARSNGFRPWHPLNPSGLAGNGLGEYVYARVAWVSNQPGSGPKRRIA
jgi:hypothetical protein